MNQTQTRLAAAYAELLAETGKRPSVRALKGAARVSTDAAAAFLREVGVTTEVPAVPDLSAPVAALWAAAWRKACQMARDETAQRVDDLGADLIAATADAEQQMRAAATARRACDEAQQQATAAAATVAALESELEAARQTIRELQAAERAALTRADRAEATVDALQKILGQLHPGSQESP